MPGNQDKKNFLGLMFAVVGIILLLTSFVLPWWGLHIQSDEEDTDYEYHSESGGGVSVASGIGFSGGGTSLYAGDFTTPVIFGITTMMLILALIFAALMITAIIINWMGKTIKPKLPMIFGILAVIFCLLAPIIFMGGLPGAMKADAEKRTENYGEEYEAPDHDDPTKSFFGSYEETDEDGSTTDTTKQSWGGDIGWFVAFISFIMLLIAFIMVIPKKAAYPPPRLPPQQPQYPPEPQPPEPQYEQPPPQYERAPPPPPQYEQPPPPEYEPPSEQYVPPPPQRPLPGPPPQYQQYDYPPPQERYPPMY